MNKFFQWIVGERQGEVLIQDRIEEDDGILYIVFKDESRINEDLIGELNATKLDNKMMAEVSSHDNVWQFKEEWVGREEEKYETNAEGESVCVQPGVAGRKTTKLIPPKRVAPKESKFGTVSKPTSEPVNIPVISTETVKEVKIISTPEGSDDPVYIMMDKAKKIDTEFNMSLTISLPSKSLFGVVKESFDDGEKKALEYIVDNIDISDIKKELKVGIEAMYNTET